MKTPMHKRVIPDGFQLGYNRKLWSVGHVFRYSEVYDCFLDCEIRLTVKPGQCLAEAFEARMDEPMWPDYEIFFREEG
jgi:hypothetical protein